MNDFLKVILEIVVVLALVAANGFFVAAEFALVKVRQSQLRPLARRGGWQVKFALHAVKRLDAALSAAQLGVTLASLGLGWVGEPFVAHHLAPLLGHLGITNPNAITSISFALAFTVITFLHIILGEQGPKWLAIQRAKEVSLLVSAPLIFFYYVFYPLIWLINASANRLLRWAGLRNAAPGEHGFSPDELEYVFSHAHHSHPGDALVNRLMVQSLRLKETFVNQIMRPREQVAVLWLDKPSNENLRIAQTSGHARFPVCEGTLDDVKGLLLVREWLWQMQALGPDTPFEPLMRPVVTFELKTPILIVLERFRLQRTHLGIVLDESKKLAGIVTFEDVLEEIIGDIRDEFDIGQGPIYEHSGSVVVVSGALTMRELRAETGWPLEWLPHETVSTWSIRHLGRVPLRDEICVLGEYQITALEVTSERLRRVRVERLTRLATETDN